MKTRETEMAKAREQEFFNTMPHNTLDEIMVLAEEVNSFREKCDHYDYMIKQCEEELKWYSKRLQEEKERYAVFESFVSSKTGKLIERFINNKDVTFEEIEREIAATGNPFEIKIIKEDQHFDHEVYGETRARFWVGKTETFYLLNVFDVDKDMDRSKNTISECQAFIDRITKRKEEIEKEGVFTLWKIEPDNCWYHDDGWLWRYNGNPVASIDGDGDTEDYFEYGEHGEFCKANNAN